jgi:hypothetical protein
MDTQAGYRCASGVGDTLLEYPRGPLGQHFEAGLELLCIAYSARRIRDFFADGLAGFEDKALLD